MARLVDQSDTERIRKLIARANAGTELAALLQNKAVQQVRANLIGGTVDAILETDDAAERERLVQQHRAFVAFFDAVGAIVKSGARAAHELEQEKS